MPPSIMIAVASAVRSGREFLSDTRAATAIEYAILASCVAVAIVTVVITTGTSLTATYQKIDDAYPN